MKIIGPDISHWNGPVDLGRAARYTGGGRYKVAFCFIKATQGTSYGYLDYWRQHSRKARDAGLLVGAYHYFLVREDGAAQARYFLDRAGDVDLYAVDVEATLNPTSPEATLGRAAPTRSMVGPDVSTDDLLQAINGPKEQVIAEVTAFAEEFHRLRPGTKLALYGRAYLRDLGIRDRMGCDWNWVPCYCDGVPDTSDYWPGRGWVVWQYTNGHHLYVDMPKSLPGVGNCDINLFNGDHAALLALAGKEEELAILSDQDQKELKQLKDALLPALGSQKDPTKPATAKGAGGRIAKAVRQVEKGQTGTSHDHPIPASRTGKS